MPGTSDCVRCPISSWFLAAQRGEWEELALVGLALGLEHSSRSPQICRHPQNVQAAGEGFRVGAYEHILSDNDYVPPDTEVLPLYLNIYHSFVCVLMIPVPVTFLPSVAMARYRDSNFSNVGRGFFKGIGYVDADIQMLTGASLELHCSTT